MKNNGKISMTQFNIILIVAIPSTSLLFVLSDVYENAKQDMWISLSLVAVYCISFSIILTKLAKMYEKKNLIQISESVLGLILGKFIGFIFLGFFIHINAVLIREFSDFLNGSLYYETPTWFFSLFILIPCIYILYTGIESIARIGQFVIGVFCISLLFILFFSFFDTDMSKLTPIIANSPMSIFEGSLRLIVWVGEFIIILMFACFIEKKEKLTRSVIFSIIIMALLIIPISMCLVAVFGSTTEFLTYPFLSLTQYVSIGRNIRIDTFILIMWVSALFFKFSIFFYCSVQSAASLYKVKMKNFIIPIGIFTLVLSETIWDSGIILKEKILTQYSIVYTIIQIGLPIMLFIVAKLKKRFFKKNKERK